MGLRTETDDSTMQQAYDSILKGWPLRQPSESTLLAAYKRAWSLQTEARLVIERAYEVIRKRSLRATLADTVARGTAAMAAANSCTAPDKEITDGIACSLERAVSALSEFDRENRDLSFDPGHAQ